MEASLAVCFPIYRLELRYKLYHDNQDLCYQLWFTSFKFCSVLLIEIGAVSMSIRVQL